MTHDELVQRAGRWLKNSARCPIVFTEIVAAGETPDAIGFNHHASHLIECKTSLTDFYRDKHKYFRREGARGMGCYRYYLCEKNLLNPNQMPERWGLLWVCGKIVRIMKKPEFWGVAERFVGLREERKLLVSVLRRVSLRWDLKQISDYSLIQSEVK